MLRRKKTFATRDEHRFSSNSYDNPVQVPLHQLEQHQATCSDAGAAGWVTVPSVSASVSASVSVSFWGAIRLLLAPTERFFMKTRLPVGLAVLLLCFSAFAQNRIDPSPIPF